MEQSLSIIILLGIFSLRLTSVGSQFTYSAIVPTSVLPGSPYKISTTLESAEGASLPVSFKYELSNEKKQVLASTEDIKLSEVGNKVTILEIKPGSLKDEAYNISVTATDAGGKVVERDNITIQKETRNTFILIQTDKPIYKPGETVKFRVFLFNKFLQPFGEDKLANVTITDPQGNFIKLWKSKVIPNGRGFISEEFQLSKEPNLGDWLIQVEGDQGTEHESHSFSVDEYVLPKYKVEISLSPKFVTFNDSKFTAEVSVMYSYGKPVSGKCTVELSDPNNYDYDYYMPRTGKWHGSRPSEPKPGITKTSKLEGTGMVRVEFDPKAELNFSRTDVQKWGKDFQIFASCKDQVYGIVRNATQSIRMYEFPYKIEMVQKPNHILPGFQVNMTIKVSYHDDVPVSDEREDALKIEHGFGMNFEEGVLFKSIPGNGLVHLSFMTGTNPKVSYDPLEVTYKHLKESLWMPSKQVSPTRSYLQIKVLTEGPVEGQSIEVQVKGSKEWQALNVFLLSRGIIVHSEVIKGAGGNEQTASLTLPRKSSPQVKLFIYVVFKDKNVISDEVDIIVKPDEKNKLEVSLSEGKVEPGHNISINVKGSPNSVLGLRAVDQSVLLLKKDDDLTLEKLYSAGDKFYSGGHYGYWSAGEVFQRFLRNGLGLLTNGEIDKGPKTDHYQTHEEPMLEMAYDEEAGAVVGSPPPAPKMKSKSAMRMTAEAVPGRADFGGGGGSELEVRVRSSFPETWIWEDIDNKDGALTLQKTLPDTITSWVISAFQIDKEHGLDLGGEIPKLTVFRPFFIALNLPYSVVKGEVLFLQVLVHNYMDKDVKAKVTLENKEGHFKFLESEETFDQMEKEVDVPASEISSVIFPILPSKFGVISLKAKAVTNEAGDAISQTLIVKPPGIKHTQTSGILVNLLKGDVFTKKKISAVFPEQRVPDADSLKVQVVGDILGGSLTNLEKLIQLPTGCAEQNMVNFVPNIVILDYLNVTGQLVPEVEDKAKRYLEQGYQRQLTFLRHDGAYSIFGNSDQVGSTWLTAYVTRAFIQAKRYIHIDDEVIHKSLRFLLGQQNDNGSFSEEGFVLYQSLQGGGPKGKKNLLAITAYTLLTLAEAQKAKIDFTLLRVHNGEEPKTANQVIQHGIKYLIKQINSKAVFQDVYSSHLITYLLHFIDHIKKDDFMEMIEDYKRLNNTAETIHWMQSDPQSANPSMKMVWQPRVSAASVEMTSYGLLTYLMRSEDRLKGAFFIAKWLIKRRNAHGGFMSSQDTVMGITALAKFAEAIMTKESLEAGVRVGLSFGSGGGDKHDFYIGKENRTVLQEYLIPEGSPVHSVSIEGSGKGTALAQLTWTYYVEAVDTSPAFHLKAELAAQNKGRNLEMKIEFFYERMGKSNMAILEGSAPSGYAFDQEELEALKQDGVFKRYELEDKDSKAQLYFESVDKTPKTLRLTAYRIHLVAKHAKGVVKIYDYYDNTRAAQFLYDVPVISTCDICQSDKSCNLKECK